MFHYQTYTNLSKGKSGECTRLILKDENGEIIFAAMELSDNHFIAGKKGDDGFDQFLQGFVIATIENDESNS